LAVSWWLVGTAQMKVYAGSLLSMSVRETAIDQAKFNVNPSMMPNLRGLIATATGTIVPALWTQILIGALSLGILLWIARRGVRRNLHEQFWLAVTAAAVLSYHLILHDLSILLIPLLTRLDGYTRSDQTEPLAATATVLMFSAPAIIAFSHARPFVIGIPLVLFLAVQGLRTGRPPDIVKTRELDLQL
jgi:hypothetical protein